MSSSGHVFLTARWRHLVMANWQAPPDLLRPLVPRGTELDLHDGIAWFSLVAFRFEDTRVLGFPVPFHRDFEEINLRFYVRRGDRRGVVFVRELVPRLAIALVARAVYHEPYRAVPTSSRITAAVDGGIEARYEWRADRRDYFIEARDVDEPELPEAGSSEEFVSEHYWGYTRRRDGRTAEYRVEHERWPIWQWPDVEISGDFSSLYGPAFGELMAEPPPTAFVATGSAVTVHRGVLLR